MKPRFGIALVVACIVAAGPSLRAQGQGGGNGSGTGQSQPAPGSQNPPAPQPPARTEQQTNQNPFPEDTSNIPVVPTHNVPGLIQGESDASNRIPMPASDSDPVRSPEDAEAAAENQQQSSSSSLAGMSDLLPPADDDAQPGKHNRKGHEIAPEHHESAAEDENVGRYYRDNKDWKAALSRFQSALVLDPDNPDVYWGLAEAERHIGQFAEARANYQKVMDYDPGSRHAKEARKALEDPAIANAKPSQAAQPSAPPQ